MKILIAPGAFKGSLTATQAADAIARGLTRSGIDAELVQLPLADGGDGTLDAFLAQGGERVPMTVQDALGCPIAAAYGILDNGATAVVELALASGLAQLAQPDALAADTYGTGELLAAALNSGAQRIIVGLGGSATTDGGAGALRALGVRFLDAGGAPISPGGAGLAQLQSIDANALSTRWREVELVL
ncbi:MAG: glycerate kinase, partial [Armatimonadetes bacterium]|nr:glycerate kinase [Anaerolineae bacterium]